MLKKIKVTCHNDRHPVAIASIVMICFKRLVMVQINCLRNDFDLHQFAYCHSRSTECALHYILDQLKNNNTYIRLLFIDQSIEHNHAIHTHLQAPRPEPLYLPLLLNRDFPFNKHQCKLIPSSPPHSPLTQVHSIAVCFSSCSTLLTYICGTNNSKPSIN